VDYPATDGAHYSGGGGLSSTAEDYAKFLQLFLNRGEFNGMRLVSPKTVELMLTEQFPAINAEFGLGFGLETPDNDHQSVRSLGSFSWGGAFATTYWADPKEGLIAQIYTNVYNSAAPQLSGRFTVLTYAAMTR
jgi:CubicO group peptidase (beta-lactamase class C family)